MNRRAFLQVAGGMVVGAIIGGNAPNPVTLPARPLTKPVPPSMPSKMAYDWGVGVAQGIKEGIKEASFGLWREEVEFFVIDGDEHKRITQEVFCKGFICGEEPICWPTAIDPTTTAEYDQEWEEM